jgi:two-component sensor histidine kinase
MLATPITLLYIDDDAATARLVRKELERHGYAVEVAPSGEEGLARLDLGGIDVVALDHYLPGCDGLETLAAIQTRPSPTPVVYVTGTEDARVAIGALTSGAADYVIKDVGGEFLALLRVAVESALAQARLLRDKEAAEAEVREARDRFAALAAERAVLLREVNHRVGNSLQLVSSFLHMQASSSDDPEVRAALTAAHGRVVAVAQVHHRLYTSDDVRAVSLDQYLQALLTDMEGASLATAGGWLSFAAEPIAVDPDRAVAVGIVVTELIINALKHAYPSGQGPVRVSLRRSADGNTHLTVEDDGVGPPAPMENSAGIGHLIIEAMAAKLGAALTLDRSHSGTRFLIEFS